MIAPTLRSRFGQPSLAVTDPWHDGVVDGRVTQRAGDAERSDVIVRVDGGLDADDGIHFQERYRRRRALQVDRLQQIPAGSTSASTLSPTDSAVVGSTLFSMTSCRRNLSVQSCSSPKVS